MKKGQTVAVDTGVSTFRCARNRPKSLFLGDSMFWTQISFLDHEETRAQFINWTKKVCECTIKRTFFFFFFCHVT